MSTTTSAPAAPKKSSPGFRQRVDNLPKAVKIALWVVFAIFLFLLPLLNIPFITTEGSDFGGVLFTVATYVLVALVTLGFGEIVRLTLVNSEWLGGAQGISDIPKPPGFELFDVPSIDWSSGAPVVDLDTTSTFLKFGINDFVPYYWLALGVISLVLLFDILVKSSRVGRAWEATREDEDAAELMGVPTFRFKLLAFALGAAIGGLSG